MSKHKRGPVSVFEGRKSSVSVNLTEFAQEIVKAAEARTGLNRSQMIEGLVRKYLPRESFATEIKLVAAERERRAGDLVGAST